MESIRIFMFVLFLSVGFYSSGYVLFPFLFYMRITRTARTPSGHSRNMPEWVDGVFSKTRPIYLLPMAKYVSKDKRLITTSSSLYSLAGRAFGRTMAE